jgi:hypothetical protein
MESKQDGWGWGGGGGGAFFCTLNPQFWRQKLACDFVCAAPFPPLCRGGKFDLNIYQRGGELVSFHLPSGAVGRIGKYSISKRHSPDSGGRDHSLLGSGLW